MLVVENLNKKFGDNRAVKDVSFSVEHGEVFSLIGPNGSGKTTIIKMIAGLLSPDSGRITVAGFSTRREPESAKSEIGYIPDEPSVWPNMTGEEYLNMSGALYSVAEDKRREKIPGLLRMFDLADTEKGYFEDFSRGNKQKFTIMSALLHEPKVLLVDEPIVGLDPVSADIAQKRFVKFAEEGGSVLMVTHTLPVAQKISHRIGVLKRGEIIIVGTYEELMAKAGFEKRATLDDIYRALTK